MPNTLSWTDWKNITQRIYENRLKGWPREEMRTYFQAGMSPLQAYEKVVQRRLKDKLSQDTSIQEQS